MTVYFMGGEVGSFTPSDAASREVTGSSIPFDASFARCSLQAESATQYLESSEIACPDTFYLHCDIGRQSSSVATAYDILILRTATTDVFKLTLTNNTIQMKALISAVWTNVGAAVSADFAASTQTVDVYVEGNDATGTATLYVAGTERTTAVVDLTAVTGIERLRIYGGGGTPAGGSQFIIADEPTIGWRLMTRYPNGAGATTTWTGGFADVDEIIYSDADFINSGAADQVETFTQTGPAISGYTVRAVGVYGRARRGASGPQNLQLALRVSGTDYFSGSNALGLGYDSYGYIWDVNPATTAAWLSAAIDAIQPGVKSIT